MAWVRIDDGLRMHPKMQEVGPLGRDLFVGALCHCNRYLTDGWISFNELSALIDYEGLFVEGVNTLPGVHERPRLEDVIESLIRAGLFEYHDGRILIHDYDHFQPSRADVLAQRERWRLAQQERRRGPKSDEQRVKDKARSLLNQAVESGRIKREPCEVCGVAKSEAHHTDYTKPLEVRWLCRRHHSKVEAALRSSDFESTLSSGVSGSGEGKSDSRARGLLCPVCGPMPYTSKRRLSEHIRLIHPEVAEAVA